MRPYLENTQDKNRTSGVVQVIECLPCKCKALSSNPSTTKKERKKNMSNFHESKGGGGEESREREEESRGH
jgi:hypothetical protein